MRTQWTLVTGASGFVGSMLVRRLVERGEHVKAFVRPGANLSVFEGLSQDRLELTYGDLTVAHTVYRSLAGCTRLFHVASPFRYWSPRPEQILQPAIEGTRAVLEAAGRRKNIERIVVTSSAGVLGVADGDELLDEGHAFNLQDPEIYVRAKIEANRVVEDQLAAGLPIVSVMPTTIFGPGDWKPTPNGRLLLEYLSLKPGRRVPATEGGVSIVDVEDVADGHILAMQRGRIGESYLLGGDNLTYRQLFGLLHELTGLAEPGKAPSPGMLGLVGRALEMWAGWTQREPLLTYRLARDYAFNKVWVTSKKAETELGYTHRPAREALTRALRWYLRHDYVPQPLASRVRLELRPA
ncbi:MAG TPA: NAD-dependent epimerase/dehydratase family protein [Polyangiaceae bacterium]|nr:NAD-dependent epimerase/dehydratase family protein [Polyangiaceae bacterium]